MAGNSHNGGVGELISLSSRLAASSGLTASGTCFCFALDSPLSYLVAERVRHALGEVTWIPVLGPTSEAAGPASCAQRAARAEDGFRLAEREARTLRLPLVRPRAFPLDSRRAARAALHAADLGIGRAFALAAASLAFCGAMDIAQDAVLAEAASVAGLDPADVVAAAGDTAYDLRLDATSRALRACGVDAPPAIGIDGRWFDGADAIMAAMSFRAARVRRRRSAPARPPGPLSPLGRPPLA